MSDIEKLIDERPSTGMIADLVNLEVAARLVVVWWDLIRENPDDTFANERFTQAMDDLRKEVRR